MELQQLRYVLAVADHGTFTAAAAACFVAQPSLSHAVRSLESELGVELFHRLGRRSDLTDAGRALLPAARAVFRSLDTMRADVDAVAGVVAGRLDLVALPTLAVDPVSPLVGTFRSSHPGVVVRLAHPEDTRELVARVLSGASEIGITELPVAEQHVATIALGRQELVAILPPGARGMAHIDLPKLARRPLVTQRPGTSTRDALDIAFASLGLVATVAVETDQREAIVPLVLAGAGAAVVPRPMATTARDRGAHVVSLKPAIWRRLGIIHRAAPLSPAARAFIDIAARSLPAPVATESRG